MDSSAIPDRIEKQIVLRASRARVWSAISDSVQFGTWFGVKFDGPFLAGRRIRGKITPTQVDAEVAQQQAPWEGAACDVIVEQIVPERLLSFRWSPYVPDEGPQGSDPAAMTLVVFELEEVPEGILLTISESGFSKVPLKYRAQAFTSNDGGWATQTRLIESYLRRNG